MGRLLCTIGMFLFFTAGLRAQNSRLALQSGSSMIVAGGDLVLTNTDLVTAGLGYTVLPLCGVRELARQGDVSISPVAEVPCAASQAARNHTPASNRSCAWPSG